MSRKDRNFKGFFRPKLGDLQKKKKKKVFAKIQSDFSAEIPNSNIFSAQNQVISKKKKKKKGLRQKSGRFFSQFRNFKRMRGGSFCMGGGYFPFFTENRPQKHKKHAILHTSQANGGGSSPPPPPPWLRYWIRDCKMLLPKHKKTTIAINISLQSAQQRQFVL